MPAERLPMRKVREVLSPGAKRAHKWLRFVIRPGSTAHDRAESHLLHRRAKVAQRIFMKAGERERGFDGLHERARENVFRNLDLAIARDALRSFGVGGLRRIKLIDFKHQVDGGDAADGVRGEDANSQADCSDKFAVDVDG